MKKYNKLPFKERQRHLDYQYNQTEKQEKLRLMREMKALEEEKLAACREYKTDKDRQFDEVAARLRAIEKGGAE